MRFFAWLMRASAARGGDQLVVDVQVAHRLLDGGCLVGRIVDDEVAREPDLRRLAPQQPRAHRVERRDPHAPAVRAQQARDARAHFLGGLVGEGDREHLLVAANPPPMRYAMRNAMTRVLPEPAPARMSSGPSVCSTASRCSGFSRSENPSGSSGTRGAVAAGLRDGVLLGSIADASASSPSTTVLLARPRTAQSRSPQAETWRASTARASCISVRCDEAVGDGAKRNYRDLRVWHASSREVVVDSYAEAVSFLAGVPSRCDGPRSRDVATSIRSNIAERLRSSWRVPGFPYESLLDRRCSTLGQHVSRIGARSDAVITPRTYACSDIASLRSEAVDDASARAVTPCSAESTR